MPGSPPSRLLRAAFGVALALALVLGAASGCNGGDEPTDDEGALGGTSSTTAAGSFDQRDAKAQLLVATTGINLVGTEVNIRTFSNTARDFCRNEAGTDLAPHRARLEAAADATVRDRAKEALARLDAAVKLCAEGADQGSVQQALERYREAWEPLLQAVEALPAG